VIVAAIWIVSRLWPVVLVLAVSLILLGTANPLVSRLQRRGLSRGVGVALILMAALLTTSGLALITVPALWAQVAHMLQELPGAQLRLADWLARSPMGAQLAETVRNARVESLLMSSSRQAMAYSSDAAALLGYGATSVALAVYLLIDPHHAQGGLYAIVPRIYHVRLARIVLNLETIVGGYMRGQLLTSGAMGLFVFVLLTVCRIPNALAMAAFAAVADVIPFVGGVLALAPVVLAVLPHGKGLTLVVVVAMILYQEFENRVLIPRVYGRALRLSAAAVTLALLVGGQLLGMVGALLALPFAAAIRMVVLELRVELPGELAEGPESRQRDAQAEETYAVLSAGAPAQEAAVIAVAIAGEGRKESEREVIESSR
jgi:predicted PurR-regulated permease PerM